MRANNNDHDDELGPNSAGQSGDLQGISDEAGANSESVKELIEQGNAFEADAVEGVENAKDPDVSEVTTREVPEATFPKSIGTPARRFVSTSGKTESSSERSRQPVGGGEQHATEPAQSTRGNAQPCRPRSRCGRCRAR